MKLFFIVYKITNMVNSKIYVGCHITKNVNDGYMGSGKLLSYAKKKYGIENFQKEILSLWETPEEMLNEEARLVNAEFVGRPDVYNLALGGKGTWRHVNFPVWRGKSNFSKCNAELSKRHVEKLKDEVYREKYSKVMSEAKRGHAPTFSKHSLESRRKMSESMQGKQTGEANSQFGTCWVFLEKPIKIKKSDLQEYLDRGYRRGRK